MREKKLNGIRLMAQKLGVSTATISRAFLVQLLILNMSAITKE